MLPIGNKNYQKSYQKMQSIDEKHQELSAYSVELSAYETSHLKA